MTSSLASLQHATACTFSTPLKTTHCSSALRIAGLKLQPARTCHSGIARTPLPASSAAATRRAAVIMSAVNKLDAHLHVWAPADQSELFPFVGALIGSSSSSPEPPLPGHVEVLVGEMQGADVAGALIVQPGNHLYDHSYVASVLKRFPTRFVGCLLADPRPDGGGAAELQRLIKEEGFRAVRFNPYLWPEGEKMTNQVGRTMYRLAGDLGAPVSHMPFNGIMRYLDEIEALLRDYPHTKCIIDHFGFCRAGNVESEEWQRLLRLGREFPQVYVKASASFRVSSQPYPYLDVWPSFIQLVDTFGAWRVLWGTDFPWVQEKEGYAAAWQLLEQWQREGGGRVLSQAERDMVLGGSLAQLFPGAWGES